MANYAIIRVEKRKLGSVNRICKHHEREKEEYKSNPDIKTYMSCENHHFICPETDYRTAVLERIEEVGAKLRKDSVVMQDGLITATPDWLKGKDDEEQLAFFRYALQFIKERYGEENIISAVVHLDEATPHMHFVFVPITRDGRLSSKDVMGGPRGMTKLQDDFYKHITEKYPEFSRGLPARVTHRVHLPTHLYKNAHDLYAHYDEICAAVQSIGFLHNGKKKDEALALLGKYAPEMAKMGEQLKTTDNRIAKLESDLANSRSTISRYASKNQEQANQIYALHEEMADLKQVQLRLKQQVDLIPPELMQQLIEAERQRRREEYRQRNRGALER